MTARWFALIGLGLAAALPAAAACPDEAAVSRYLVEFAAAKPSAQGLGRGLDLADAVCGRARLLTRLAETLGRRVGYKALFTNADAQRRFGVSAPAWGAMHGRMMLTSPARLSAAFGARPRYEADLVVEVKDAGLADAVTPAEALDHISAVVPFVELPDLMLEGAITGPELIAANAAFRGGVLGPRVPVAPGLADALAGMDVVVTEERASVEVGRAKGRVLMENPLNAAIWLARALRQDGVILKAGDLLSLGGFVASAPTRAGTVITVRYLGLPGDPAVTVHFE